MTTIDRNDLYAKKLALVAVAKRCFERGLQTNAGGNLSVRLSGVDAIVIKPSGVGFNECTPDNLMVADLEGRTVEGHGKPSKDLDFHADLYKVRPDIGAIVHVHSPWATGWGSAPKPPCSGSCPARACTRSSGTCRPRWRRSRKASRPTWNGWKTT